MANNMVTGAGFALLLLSGAVLTACDEPESQPPAQQTTVPTDPSSQDQQKDKPAGEQQKPQQQGEQK